MAAIHRRRDEIAAHAPCDVSGYGRCKEKPCMRAVAGPRSLDRDRNVLRATGFGERSDVLFPRAFIKVNGEEPSGLVLQHGIAADDMTPPEVVNHYPVLDGYECLISTIAAFASGLEMAQARLPFI